jgi:hypothetical protein
MEGFMGKLVFTALLAGAGLLIPPALTSMPFVVDVRPAAGEHVVLRVDRADSLHVRATAAGLRVEGGRLVEFVAPGTLEITGGDGALELVAANPGAGFVLGFKREVGGVRREFEASGRRATIRVRGGQLFVDAETMTMREVRAP